MKFAKWSLLSSSENRNRNCVVPVLLILFRPVALIVALYQPFDGVLLKLATLPADAAALKSPNSSAVLLLKALFRTSTTKLPSTLKGSTLFGVPLCRILRTADCSTAVSGKAAV